jgi:hypothetical protein
VLKKCASAGLAAPPIAPQHGFCSVSAFRGALESDEAPTELSEALVRERRFGHYEILTHENGSLFDLGRGAMAVMQQHLISPLSLEKLQEVSQPAVALIEVLLRKDPAKRFPTPGELLKALPTVIDAIETGQSLWKTIRVFVSSSSEVQSERNLANRIVRGIAGESGGTPDKSQITNEQGRTRIANVMR